MRGGGGRGGGGGNVLRMSESLSDTAQNSPLHIFFVYKQNAPLMIIRMISEGRGAPQGEKEEEE